MVVASSRFVIQRLSKPCLVLRSCSPKLNSFNYRPELLRCSSQLQIRFCSSSRNERENIGQQLKRLVGQYGSIVMVFHVSISLASLGFFYLIVSNGIDVVPYLKNVPYIGDQLNASSVAAGASTFVIAYAVHKVFAPVRMGITATSVPFIVRYLRTKGLFKKPPIK